MRKNFLNFVSEMICKEADTVFLTVDIGMWAIKDTLSNHSDRCMNIGIFEDGMMSFAAGMSRRGFIPTIFGIQPYLIERALEQIKMDLAYQKLGINVVGTGASCDYSKYGYSHYCPEDAMIIKSIPGCEFIAPGTARQFLQLYHSTYRNGNPTFFRISDHPNKIFDFDVSFGKANIIKNGSKATVVVVSVLLDEVMEACANLDVTVLYYTTLQPFDYVTLKNNCSSKKVLIVEPEFDGTLYYDVCSALKDNAIYIDSVAFPREIFRNYGTYDEKISYYGLNAENVRKKIINLIKE